MAGGRGGNGPWGGSRQGMPPELDRLLLFVERWLRKGVAGPIMIVGLVLLFIILITGFFRLEVNEIGVIQRFGKYVREVGPGGLHFKIPLGVESARKVVIEYKFREEFGYRTPQRGVRSVTRREGYEYVSHMLTGDLNIMEVPWTVQYKIVDPYKFLFKVRAQLDTLRDLSESAMRLAVGERSVGEVLSKRDELARECQKFLQIAVDEAELGIEISTIELKTTNVPPKVQPAFNDVNKAVQDKEAKINKADEERRKKVQLAEGEANKMIEFAKGDAIAAVNEAKGDANRYLKVLKEYRRGKNVTRRRLYLEAVKEVFPNMGPKFIIDEDVKSLLPLLNLNPEGPKPKGGGK